MWKETIQLNRRIERERMKQKRLKEAMKIAVKHKYILIYERKEVKDGKQVS